MLYVSDLRLLTVMTDAVCVLASPEILSGELSPCCPQSVHSGTWRWRWLTGRSHQLVSGSDINWRSWLNVSQFYHHCGYSRAECGGTEFRHQSCWAKGSCYGAFNWRERKNEPNSGLPLVVEELQGFQLQKALPPDQGLNPWTCWRFSPKAQTPIAAPCSPWFTALPPPGSYFYQWPSAVP